MKIAKINAQEIYDSRGIPTIGVRVELENGMAAYTAYPSGSSDGSHEALDLRDGGKRLKGKGVTKAVKNVEEETDDERENQFLASLNFDLGGPAPQIELQPEMTPIIQPLQPTPPFQSQQTLPVEPTPQSDDVEFEPTPIEETAQNEQRQQPAPTETEALTPKPTPAPRHKETTQEGYPVKKEEFVHPRGAKKVPLASNINFTNKPVFTLNISGQEPRYFEGLSNLKVNRAIKKFDTSKQIFPIKGERKFEISPELERRFKDDDLEVKKIEVLNIEGSSAPIKPTPTIQKTQFVAPPQPQKQELPTPTVLQKSAETIPTQPDIKAEGTELPKETLPPLPVTPPQNHKVAIPPTFNFKTKEFEAPSIPNIISGIVRDNHEVTLQQVIIIIKNEAGVPVRALKSNKLGQFSIATPLPDGRYTIEFEKEGCKFNPIDLELKGEVIPIIDIRSIS